MTRISNIIERIKSGESSARAEVENAIRLAKSTDEYHALLSVTEARAFRRAEEIDARIQNGENVGRLAGVPFIAKDNFLAFGAPTTAASRMLEKFDAPLQALLS